MSKRKLPRRELPWIGTLLDNLPFSRLPTNSTVLRRLFFLTETSTNIQTSRDEAAIVVKNELLEVWTYAGYGDILYHPSSILRKIKGLVTKYKSLNRIPVSRRSTDSYLKKEISFKDLLPKLFDITIESLRYSNKITLEDRKFLFHHWWKPISSTPDLKLKKTILKKLDRKKILQLSL